MRSIAIVCVLAAAAHAQGKPEAKTDAKAEAKAPVDDPIAKYYTQLAANKLIDVESGTLETLKRELAVGEGLLRDGAYTNAAVALYAIVKSPRYASFTDFIEFENAEYDLAVALERSGAYGSALEITDQILARGPSSKYWGPGHRVAVDIAIETRDYAGVLARIDSIKTPSESTAAQQTIPPSAAGERAYLRGRAAYENGKLADAEGELVLISKKSRMYSSAVYLRGVIRARRGEYKDAAEAMCEVAGTSDAEKITFVVDDRYFTIKDLARLGLGRIAHEQGEYDDAYYHYFQIPDDSAYLPDALFEASWSMYQKRELATSRDLVHEFINTFPSSPLWPEASLLAGYVELADCKFDDSQKWYDELIGKLQPVVNEIDLARKDPDLRRQLYAKAMTRFHEIKETGEVAGKAAGKEKAETPFDQMAALLRLDPKFLRLDDAVTGSKELSDSAGQAVRQWQNLATQVSEAHVAKVSTGKTAEQESLADANTVVEDLRRLGAQVATQRGEIARARREGTMPGDAAKDELARLEALSEKVQTATANAVAAADKAAKAAAEAAAPGIKPMIEADLADARRLDKASHALHARLAEAGEKLAQGALDKLYDDTRRVLDKAKLGKVDAVIGQKRKLDIEVQDLAAGRFPEELIGRMWNASMIGDDEEYWPFQGEYWADEYEGWR